MRTIVHAGSEIIVAGPIDQIGRVVRRHCLTACFDPPVEQHVALIETRVLTEEPRDTVITIVR